MAYVAEAPNLTCCPGASDSTLRASELLLTLKMGARRVPQAIPHDVKPGIGVRLTATLELRASKLVSPRPGHCPLLLDCQVWQSASGSLDLEADPRTWFAIVAIEFAAFRGAMVKVTADEPVADSTDVAIPWEAVLYDTDAFWSAGNPTRLTVPAGVRSATSTTSTGPSAARATGTPGSTRTAPCSSAGPRRATRAMPACRISGLAWLRSLLAITSNSSPARHLTFLASQRRSSANADRSAEAASGARSDPDAAGRTPGLARRQRRRRLPLTATRPLMADDSLLPSYPVRPGVTFPDWAAVTSPQAREALLAIFEAFGVERTWRDYTRAEDAARTTLLRLHAELGADAGNRRACKARRRRRVHDPANPGEPQAAGPRHPRCRWRAPRRRLSLDGSRHRASGQPG